MQSNMGSFLIAEYLMLLVTYTSKTVVWSLSQKVLTAAILEFRSWAAGEAGPALWSLPVPLDSDTVTGAPSSAVLVFCSDLSGKLVARSSS